MLFFCSNWFCSYGSQSKIQTEISSFESNGRLSFSRVDYAEKYHIEWAPSPSGPWNDSWDELKDIPPFSQEIYTISVPMLPESTFYRVVTTLQPLAPPAVGELIISEIMYDPTGISDTKGDWLELRNVSGGYLNLAGLTIDTGRESILDNSQPILLAPGETFLLARRLDLGLGHDEIADHTFDDALNNSCDTITVSHNGYIIDEVIYDSTYGAEGASLSLYPEFYDASSNDDPNSWYISTNIYDAINGNCGTPNMDNADFEAQ